MGNTTMNHISAKELEICIVHKIRTKRTQDLFPNFPHVS